MSYITYAGTAADILKKYGVYNQIDVTELKNELKIAQENYKNLYKDYKNTISIDIIKELANELIYERQHNNNIQQISNQLEYDYKYLKKLVEINSELDLIFEAEQDYRATKAKLKKATIENNLLEEHRENINQHTKLNPNVREEDIKKAEIEVRKLQNKLTTAIDYGNIGETINLKSPISSGEFRITSKYGYRVYPLDNTKRDFHYGLDIAAKSNDDILAVFNGKDIVSKWNNSLGNYIIIDHGYGVQTLYAHLAKSYVNEGSIIKQYQHIGLAGMTGDATGTHLHLGIYINGIKLDASLLYK